MRTLFLSLVIFLMSVSVIRAFDAWTDIDNAVFNLKVDNYSYIVEFMGGRESTRTGSVFISWFDWQETDIAAELTSQSLYKCIGNFITFDGITCVRAMSQQLICFPTGTAYILDPVITE